MRFINGNLNTQIDMHDSMFQFPPISSNFAQPLKRSGRTIHCMRQIVVTPDTDWFSDPHPYLFLKVYVTNGIPSHVREKDCPDTDCYNTLGLTTRKLQDEEKSCMLNITGCQWKGGMKRFQCQQNLYFSFIILNLC